MGAVADLYGPARAADFAREKAVIEAYLEHLQTALRPQYAMVRPRKVGGSAIIVELSDRASGQPALLKFNRPNAWPGEEPLVAREARRLAGLRHPHIVTLVDAGGSDEVAPRLSFLVEPFTKNPRTLEEHMRARLAALGSDAGSMQGRPAGQPSTSTLAGVLGELERFVRDWGEALSFLHSRGIVVLDVKPENVTVNSEGLLQLIDLGSAEELDGADETPLHIHVTRRYAHPDLLRRMRVVPPSSRKECIMKRSELRVELDDHALGKSIAELLSEVARAAPQGAPQEPTYESLHSLSASLLAGGRGPAPSPTVTS